MSTKHPCCPPGSLGKSNATCHSKGLTFNIGGERVYITGNGPKTVIYIYDIYGFNGGHTQKMLDELASQGFTVVMPDIMHGDAWGEEAPVDEKCFKWILDKKAAPVVKYVSESLLPVLKSLGKTEFAAAGSCMGAWLAVHLCVAIKEIKLGVSFHPSYQIEDMQGGKFPELAAQVTQPQILFPAGNDPADVKPNGSLIALWAEKTGGKVESYPMETEQHGYMNRGDLSQDHTLKAYEETLHLTGNFLKKYL